MFLQVRMSNPALCNIRVTMAAISEYPVARRDSNTGLSSSIAMSRLKIRKRKPLAIVHYFDFHFLAIFHHFDFHFFPSWAPEIQILY